MMVSLGHPQTHVGERGEPSKFEKKVAQDSCTVYMIIVHKLLAEEYNTLTPPKTAGVGVI